MCFLKYNYIQIKFQEVVRYIVDALIMKSQSLRHRLGTTKKTSVRNKQSKIINLFSEDANDVLRVLYRRAGSLSSKPPQKKNCFSTV